jgi:tryptophan 2,3-dioxygenase
MSDHLTKDLMEYHNLDQVLQVIKMICQENSKMPIFIMKLYALWMHNMLTKLTASKTLLPKEDIEVFRKMYKDQFEVIMHEIDKMLDNAETIERVKAAQETKHNGL